MTYSPYLGAPFRFNFSKLVEGFLGAKRKVVTVSPAGALMDGSVTAAQWLTQHLLRRHPGRRSTYLSRLFTLGWLQHKATQLSIMLSEILQRGFCSVNSSKVEGRGGVGLGRSHSRNRNRQHKAPSKLWLIETSKLAVTKYIPYNIKYREYNNEIHKTPVKTY